MTIGVTLNNKHSLDNYGMWLTDVDIVQPEVQTHYVQVPGRDSELDLTEALTGDVRYYNGTTTMTFQTTEKICGRSWLEQLEMVRKDLHGQRVKFTFDETTREYSGRSEVSGTPTAGGVFEITVTVTVDDSADNTIYDNFFAVYSASDDSLSFYGDDELPSGTYKGKAVTTVYTGLESTGSSNPPWYSDRTTFKSVKFDESFNGARPTSCYRWFYGFSNCTAVNELKYLNTSSVTTMYWMFHGCSSITTLNVSNFDTSSVTTMYAMFYACSSLVSLDVSGFDTSKVTNLSYMFYSCPSLTTLDMRGFDTSKVTSMSYMFYDCPSLTTLDVSGFNTSSATNLSYMFRACSSLVSLDVSGFDTSKVTSMSYMFHGCSNLTTIYSDDSKFVTDAVTSGGAMFTNCSKLVGGNGTAYSSSNVTYAMAHVDTASNPGYFTQR